jgi:hypothetical protein
VGLDADQLTGVAPVNIGEQLQPFFFSSRQRSVITLEEAIPSRDVLATQHARIQIVARANRSAASPPAPRTRSTAVQFVSDSCTFLDEASHALIDLAEADGKLSTSELVTRLRAADTIADVDELIQNIPSSRACSRWPHNP